MRRRLAAFRHAFEGLRHTLASQPNARLHALATVVVILLGALLKVPRRDWALLALAIGAVWVAELANTALEALIDLASPDVHVLAKMGKDIGAASVLVAAVAAAVVGIIVLGPPLVTVLLGD